jgi:hypothetical protein
MKQEWMVKEKANTPTPTTSDDDILPSSKSKEVMMLFLYLSVAAAWKNMVLSSPSLVHLTKYLFFQ